jgi:hypothetical protein
MSTIRTPTNLYRLRERLAKEFQDILDQGEPLTINGEVVRDKHGAAVMQRPSAAMLSTIRQFLRDNGIDRDPIEVDPGKPALVKSLPFEDGEVELLPPPKESP